MKKHILQLCITCAITVSCILCNVQEQRDKKEITEIEQTLTTTGADAPRTIDLPQEKKEETSQATLEAMSDLEELDRIDQLEQKDPTLTEKIKLLLAYLWYKTLNAKHVFWAWLGKNNQEKSKA